MTPSPKPWPIAAMFVTPCLNWENKLLSPLAPGPEDGPRQG